MRGAFYIRWWYLLQKCVFHFPLLYKICILYNNAYNFPGLALPPRAAILAHRQPCRHKRFSSVLNPSFRSPALAGSHGDKKTARTSKDVRRGNDSRRRGFPRLHGFESRSHLSQCACIYDHNTNRCSLSRGLLYFFSFS